MDQWVFDLGSDPFSVITFGTDASNYSQPPFFPVALAPFAFITGLFFGEFLASRISFTIFELLGFLITAKYLSISKSSSVRDKKIALLILAFSPIGFMAGTVMRTEEAIVMIFTSALILAMKKGREKPASILIFLGMITGKILFGVMFFPLLITLKNKKEVFKWGIYPALIFLIVYCVIGYSITGMVPFIEFSPSSTAFCLSMFTLIQQYSYIGITGGFLKWTSLALVFAFLTILWIIRKKLNRADFNELALLSFIILFLFFYHIIPEYLIYALPLFAVVPMEHKNKVERHFFHGLHLVLALASTGFGIAYGLKVYAKGFGYKSLSKDLALNMYNKALGNISIEILEKSLLIISVIALFLLLFMIYKHLNLKNRAVIIKPY